MKKNIFDKQAAREIMARVENIQPGTTPHWGKMNATEMLLHCNLANGFVMSDRVKYKSPTVKQRFVRFACFHIIPRIPKHNKSPLRINAKGIIEITQFSEQKKKFVQTIRELSDYEKPIASLHPRMGYLNRKQWGTIIWMHMDHHLRQFGS